MEIENIAKIIEENGFQLVENLGGKSIVFNFPPEKEGEGPNGRINLVVSLNGDNTKLKAELRSAQLLDSNLILFEGNRIFLVLPPELQSEAILMVNALVVERKLLQTLINKHLFIPIRYLPQAETTWYVCYCGKKWPIGTLEAEPHPIFNTAVNEIINTECYTCAKKAPKGMIRFG